MIRSINGTAMKFPINSICDNCHNDPFHKWNGNEIYF